MKTFMVLNASWGIVAVMTPQVVWSNPFGDIFLDADIKLFEFEDIQKYSGYNDPPKSKEFCRFYTSSSSKVQWEENIKCK